MNRELVNLRLGCDPGGLNRGGQCAPPRYDLRCVQRGSTKRAGGDACVRTNTGVKRMACAGGTEITVMR